MEIEVVGGILAKAGDGGLSAAGGCCPAIGGAAFGTSAVLDNIL